MGKDTPHSANWFSGLEKCMARSTKDMLDSKVPSKTEEVVSNPPTLQPDDLPYILMCSITLWRSTHIPLTIHTIDSNFPMAMNMLIDCGTTGQFIDFEYVQSYELHTYCLPHAITVDNVDGTPNKVGHITKAIDLVICYKDHNKQSPFYVSSIGHKAVILGHPWFIRHNPEINWHTGEVSMTCCQNPVEWLNKEIIWSAASCPAELVVNK